MVLYYFNPSMVICPLDVLYFAKWTLQPDVTQHFFRNKNGLRVSFTERYLIVNIEDTVHHFPFVIG